jgi:hypothetical protein
VRCSSAAPFAILALLVLAACGNLPRPFQPDDKSLANPLLQRAEHAGVVVMPLSGVDDDAQSQDFAVALAAALRGVDVVAHNGAGNRTSPVLSSYLEPAAGGQGTLILWLSNGAGTDIGTYEIPVRPRDLLTDTPARRQAMRGLAERVAAELDPDRARQRGMPAVHVQRVGGLPAAQSAALEAAIAFWLRRARLEIAEGPTPGAVVIAGGVVFRDRPEAKVAVDVVWRVLGGDGVELGRLSQQNEVPVAVLSQVWGEVATAIAENATEGIVDLVARARARAAP